MRNKLIINFTSYVGFYAIRKNKRHTDMFSNTSLAYQNTNAWFTFDAIRNCYFPVVAYDLHAETHTAAQHGPLWRAGVISSTELIKPVALPTTQQISLVKNNLFAVCT